MKVNNPRLHQRRSRIFSEQRVEIDHSLKELVICEVYVRVDELYTVVGGRCGHIFLRPDPILDIKERLVRLTVESHLLPCWEKETHCNFLATHGERDKERDRERGDGRRRGKKACGDRVTNQLNEHIFLFGFSFSLSLSPCVCVCVCLPSPYCHECTHTYARPALFIPCNQPILLPSLQLRLSLSLSLSLSSLSLCLHPQVCKILQVRFIVSATSSYLQ